jgi:uncharacterized protein YbjT (DUF2867 family)
MEGKRAAAIFGATGLVGCACLDLLLAEGQYGRVIALGRREPARSNAKLQVHRVSLDSVEEIDNPALGVIDDVFCCLGTTIRKAGSQGAFRSVDFGYVVNAATFAKRRGARQFLLVTAVGADARSRVFYSRVKGEVEEAVAKIGIESVSIFRPSLILGEREESRLKERFAKLAVSALSFAMIGPLSKFRPIEAAMIARAMLAAAALPASGVRVYEFEEMMGIAVRNA